MIEILGLLGLLGLIAYLWFLCWIIPEDAVEERRIHRIVLEGQRYPVGYRCAWFDPVTMRKIAYPIGLCWIAAGIRALWQRSYGFRPPPTAQDEILINARHAGQRIARLEHENQRLSWQINRAFTDGVEHGVILARALRERPDLFGPGGIDTKPRPGQDSPDQQEPHDERAGSADLPPGD